MSTVENYFSVNTDMYCWVDDVAVQEAIVKILKMRKRISNAALQTELVEILKNMFLPSKKMIKEQIEWLIEHRYMRRDEDNINQFIYMAWYSCHLTAVVGRSQSTVHNVNCSQHSRALIVHSTLFVTLLCSSF